MWLFSSLWCLSHMAICLLAEREKSSSWFVETAERFFCLFTTVEDNLTHERHRQIVYAFVEMRELCVAMPWQIEERSVLLVRRTHSADGLCCLQAQKDNVNNLGKPKGNGGAWGQSVEDTALFILKMCHFSSRDTWIWWKDVQSCEFFHVPLENWK